MWTKFLLSLFLVLLSASITESITADEVQAARSLCREAIAADSDNIAGFVRLAFHDCVGGCDGCVNPDLMNEVTGELPNAGLRRYVMALQIVIGRKPASMSRADFWIVCADESLQQGRRNAGGLTEVPVVLGFGRVDCGVSPFTTSTANSRSFPNPHHGLSETRQWCQTAFGLNVDQCIALIGAHTLGRARAQVSGFNGPWVRGPGTIDLNNAYFRELQGRDWVQRERVGSPVVSEQRWQFERQNGPPLLMLNSDMCFARAIQPAANGEVSPPNSNAHAPSETAPIVNRYAANNELWIADFGAAFTIMINRGSAGLTPATGTVTTVLPTPPPTSRNIPPGENPPPGGLPPPGGNPPPNNRQPGGGGRQPGGGRRQPGGGRRQPGGGRRQPPRRRRQPGGRQGRR